MVCEFISRAIFIGLFWLSAEIKRWSNWNGSTDVMDQLLNYARQTDSVNVALMNTIDQMFRSWYQSASKIGAKLNVDNQELSKGMN